MKKTLNFLVIFFPSIMVASFDVEQYHENPMQFKQEKDNQSYFERLSQRFKVQSKISKTDNFSQFKADDDHESKGQEMQYNKADTLQVNVNSELKVDPEVKSYELTSESYDKIVQLDFYLNTLASEPIRAKMQALLPIDKLSKLLAEMKNMGKIPTDIGKRLDEITAHMQLMPKMNHSFTAFVINRMVSEQTVLDYIDTTLSSLATLIHAENNAEVAQIILDQNSNDSLTVLKEIHDFSLKKVKKISIEKILKAFDRAMENSENVASGTKKINSLVTNFMMIVSALSLACFALSFIEGITQNAKVKKIMEIVMMIDMAIIIGDVSYKAGKFVKALKSDEAVEEPQTPATTGIFGF